mgnify:FL=1
MNEKCIDDLLAMETADLLKLIGEESAKNAGPTDWIERGREIYLNLKEKLRETICKSEKVRNAWLENQVENTHIIISAIIDCISGFVIGITPATVAVLLYKDGLPEYCSAFWGDEAERPKHS